MRLYFFNVFHLSPIQQGIQAGHAAVELMLKYPLTDADDLDSPNFNPATLSGDVHDWANVHKTFILLNGGTSNRMATIKGMLESPDNPFAWAEFREPDLENVLTSLCVLLPERMYNGQISYESLWEVEFTRLRESCPLAR